MNFVVQLAAGAVSYLVYAHYRGKQIHYIFKRTKENFDLLGRINKAAPVYSPSIYLPNSYLKTISNFASVKNTSYRRQIVPAFHGGQVALDHYSDPSKPKTEKDTDSKKKPLILIVPGFGTSSTDLYVYNAVKALYAGSGWNVCVFNQKGVGDLPFKVT